MRDKSHSAIAFEATSIKLPPEKSSKSEIFQTTELPLFSAEDPELLGDSSTMVQSIVDLDDSQLEPKPIQEESTRVHQEETRIQPSPALPAPSLASEATYIGAKPSEPEPDARLQDEPTRIGATPRPISLPSRNPSGEIPIHDEPTRIGATPRPITIPARDTGERAFREEPTRIGLVPESTSPKISTEFTSEPTAIHALPPEPSNTKKGKKRRDQFQDEKTNIHRGAVDIELGPGVQLGDYEIESYVGAGGMGEIWKATDSTTKKKVAIKVLLEELLDNDVLIARFFQEAKSINELRHPNIVEIYSVSELPDGRPYFTMEFLEGKTLGQYIKDHGPLPFGEISSIFTQLCGALQMAHDNSIVHRDLKPENIYLLQQDTNHIIVKVLDFGVAKLLSPEARGLTHSGAFIGTPAYVSPEQCAGAQTLDHRADIYAVGIILFEMITGRTPFEEPNESNALVMVKQMSTKAPPPSTMVREREVPLGVDSFVCSLLEKEPEDRPQRCADLPAMLLKALKEKKGETWEDLGSPVPVYALGVGETKKKPNKLLEPVAMGARPGAALLPAEVVAKLKRFAWPIAAALLLLVGVLLGGYLQKDPPKTIPTPTTASALAPSGVTSVPASEPVSQLKKEDLPKKEEPKEKEEPKNKTSDDVKERPKDTPKNPKEEPKNKDSQEISAKVYAGMVDATVQRADFSPCTVHGAGRVLTKLTINPKGKVTQAITSGSAMGQCVAGILKKTKFPASGAEHSFSYPVYVK